MSICEKEGHKFIEVGKVERHNSFTKKTKGIYLILYCEKCGEIKKEYII